MLSATEEICGTTKRGKQQEKETWWWNEAVQEKLKKKEQRFKDWQKLGGDCKFVYKRAKNEAKAAVAQAKDDALEFFLWQAGHERKPSTKWQNRVPRRGKMWVILAIRYLRGTLLVEEKLN